MRFFRFCIWPEKSGVSVLRQFATKLVNLRAADRGIEFALRQNTPRIDPSRPKAAIQAVEHSTAAIDPKRTSKLHQEIVSPSSGIGCHLA
jgi:hypothetical protein